MFFSLLPLCCGVAVRGVVVGVWDRTDRGPGAEAALDLALHAQVPRPEEG